MAGYRTRVLQAVAQHTALSYEADLRNQDGNAVLPVDLAVLTATVYKRDTLEIINGVDALSILNVGRGELDANGHLVLVLNSGDLAILDPAAPHEAHVLLIEGIHSGGARRFVREIHHTVQRVAHG